MLVQIGRALLDILQVTGWMGIVLFILSFVNIACSMVYNIVMKKETFSWKRLFSGLGKTGLFYGSAVLIAIAFTILPFVNTMVADMFGQELISGELLQSLSGVGVLSTIIGAIANQGLKAYEGVKKLGNVKGEEETITWEVKDE